MKTLTCKDTCTPKLIAMSFMVAQTQMQPRAQVSVDGGMDVENAGCIYNGTLFSHKKTPGILPLVTRWMDLENIMLHEIN